MEFLERVRWTNETPAIYVNYYYEYQRSGADMKYRIKVSVEPVTGQRYFGYPINLKVTMDGSDKVTYTVKGSSPSQWSSNIEWTSDWYTISNKTTGTTSLALNMTSNNRNQTNYYNMYVAPAYTSVSQWSVTSKTETSITLTWKTADICSEIRYGTSTSSYTTASVNSNTGSVTINNLSAYTNYTLYFMPKRKDSNLWGDGGDNTWKSLQERTHNYPFVSTSPNFNVESPVTLTLYNPLGRECSVAIYGADDSLIKTVTTSSTTTGAILDDETSYNNLYNSIPNASSGVYRTITTYDGHNLSATGGTYSTVQELCNPTFTDFTYADVNEDTLALTGNNKYHIVGYSSIAAIVHQQEKAVARKGATMSKYQFSIGDGERHDFPYITLDTSEVIDNAPAGAFNVYAVDSRGNATLVTKTAERTINYTPITRGNITVARQDNVGEAVTLTFNGTIWYDPDGFGDVDNSITNVTYRFKKTTDQNWTTGVTSITPTVNESNYSFTGSIAGDTAQLGFDAGSSYNIEVTVSDALSSITFTTTLGSGTPNMAFYQDGVSFGGKYDESDYNNNKHQFYGNTKIVGNENVNGDVDITGNYKINGTPLSIPVLDTAVSTTSTNGVQNQAITNYVNSKHSDTGWLSVPKGSNVYDSSWNPLKYRKKDGIVTVVGTVDVRGASSWGRALATLPAGARPVGEFDIICRTSTAPNNCQVAFATDGTIIFLTCGENWGQYSGDHTVFIAATFIAA